MMGTMVFPSSLSRQGDYPRPAPHAVSSALRKASTGCAPETAYFPSRTKNGTPWIPIAFAIGEWHFHPANRVEPSGEDFAQMIEISRAREYDCKEPLLLILGASKREGQRIFRAFVCPADDEPIELHEVAEGAA